MDDGRVTVPRVFAAMDCSRSINPGQVAAQVEGSVIDALGPTLRAKLSLEDAASLQSNYSDYELLRIDEAPDIILTSYSGAC